MIPISKFEGRIGWGLISIFSRSPCAAAMCLCCQQSTAAPTGSGGRSNLTARSLANHATSYQKKSDELLLHHKYNSHEILLVFGKILPTIEQKKGNHVFYFIRSDLASNRRPDGALPEIGNLKKEGTVLH